MQGKRSRGEEGKSGSFRLEEPGSRRVRVRGKISPAVGNPVRKIRTVRGKTRRYARDIVYYRERGIRSVGWKRIMEPRRDRSTIMHNVTRRVVNITVNGNGSVILRAETHGGASLPVNVPIFFRSIFLHQRKSRKPRLLSHRSR